MAAIIDVILAGAKKTIKPVADGIAKGGKKVSEYLDHDSRLIEGMNRSIQIDRYGCGAQCAYMILRHFGKARNVDAVKSALGTNSDDGTTDAEILDLMRKRGLKVSIFRRRSPHSKPLGSIERHIKKDAPILAWMKTRKEDHWVVVYGYSQTHYWILDPSPKNTLGVKVTRTRFLRRWSSYGMAISKEALNK